jgi:hypothetical protein
MINVTLPQLRDFEAHALRPFPAVIACDKCNAFAQGSSATKQSSPLLSGLLRFARNDVVATPSPW